MIKTKVNSKFLNWKLGSPRKFEAGYVEEKRTEGKQDCKHDSISRVRWAGAVSEVRSPFGEKK